MLACNNEPVGVAKMVAAVVGVTGLTRCSGTHLSHKLSTNCTLYLIFYRNKTQLVHFPISAGYGPHDKHIRKIPFEMTHYQCLILVKLKQKVEATFRQFSDLKNLPCQYTIILI